MTRRFTAVCALVVVMAASWVHARAQTQVFRSGSDLVTVDVSVRSGSLPVAHLTASDFTLTDNGVAQSIEAVSAEAVPLDVTLLVDTSGSVVRNLDAFKSDMKKLIAMLRADDQVRLLTFAEDMTEVFPMQPPSRNLPVDKITGGGATSLYDAVVFALARAPQPGRRHLIFLFTDGDDNSSFVGPTSLAELASRAEAVLHVVLVGGGSFNVAFGMSGALAIQPRMTPGIRALTDAASRTGGVLASPASTDRDVVSAFKQVFDDFRQGYVLRYSATGVPRPGWHDIVLNVTAPGGPFTIRARKGYFGG